MVYSYIGQKMFFYYEQASTMLLTFIKNAWVRLLTKMFSLPAYVII